MEIEENYEDFLGSSDEDYKSYKINLQEIAANVKKWDWDEKEMIRLYELTIYGEFPYLFIYVYKLF